MQKKTLIKADLIAHILDIISASFIILLLFAIPILLHYESRDSKNDSHTGRLSELILKNFWLFAILFVIGFVRLSIRYSSEFSRLFPNLDAVRFWRAIQILIIPTVWLVMYISKTFWR